MADDTVLTTRGKLNALLDRLSEAELLEILRFSEGLHFDTVMQSHEPDPNYDPTNDPAIGFFSDTSDAAASTRVKEIYREYLEEKFGQPVESKT